MIRKVVICPARLRRLPRQFSWIDQRLVREGYLQRCDCEALALYLVLVTVADAQGLSYYGEDRLSRCLSLPLTQLQRARAMLVAAGLIAYQAPLYQVLDLTPPAPIDRRERLTSLRKILEATGD
jgi:hypothetical protein